MSSRTNRSLAAKADKARNQRIEAAQMEYTKLAYLKPKPTPVAHGVFVPHVYEMGSTRQRMRAHF